MPLARVCYGKLDWNGPATRSLAEDWREPNRLSVMDERIARRRAGSERVRVANAILTLRR